MRGFAKLAWIEIKLYLRQPEAAFFTLFFPLILLFIFGSIYGNEPSPFFNGRGMVDVSTPAYLAMIIGSVGLLSIAIAVAGYREKGVLRRYRATPLRPAAILASEVIVHFLMTLLGGALLIAAARIVYGLRFPGRAVVLLAGFTLGAMSFFAVGFLLASVARTARVAFILGLVLYFPNLFLSGAAIPKETFPQAIRSAGKFIPLTHVVDLLQGLWFGDPIGQHLTEIAVLTGLLVLGVVVSAWTFRWE
ncbi:MAG TPA: ABC transporter permease [Candidatus Aminicenantes bacterium]|nr:ABC transporter permease [Candidatus Aminicenantes bacterium]